MNFLQQLLFNIVILGSVATFVYIITHHKNKKDPKHSH